MVEDDPDQILIFRTQFEIDGFEVLDAKKYQDVEKLILEEKPDIVLLDLVLGAEKGEDILKKLHEKKITKQTKIYIFSNLILGKDEERFKNLGAMGFWPKTKFYPSQLSEMILKCLK